MHVQPAGSRDHLELIRVWEGSVRATHDFLTEADIQALRPLLLEQYFHAVDLWCVRDGQGAQGGILGFSGVAGGKLEMLFVAAESRGRGVGSALCRHALERLGVTAVDVNEQNPQAVGFYEHMGFVVTGRSPLDGQGRPFPLLHMQLRP